MKVTGLLVGILLLSGTLLAQSWKEKLSPELRESGANSNIDVIIEFDQVPTEAYHQKVTSRGGQLKSKLDFINSGAYKVPSSSLADLASDPAITHISVDHKLGAKLDYTAAAINAPQVWQLGWTGAGIGVALIDSGLMPSLDLLGRVVYAQEFNNGILGLDLYGHGTHVAGIIAGSGASSSCKTCTRTLKGMAPGANLLDLQVLDQNGESTDSIVISAIETAIQLKSKYNVRVINLSLGRPVTESYTQDPLCQAVEAAWNAGIVVVVAAGNDGRDNSVGEEGYGTINAPGNDPYVITVGAMKSMQTLPRTDDRIASYSSKGPTLFDNIVKPDIVAPGNQIVSIKAIGPNTLAQAPQTAVLLSYYMNTTSTSISSAYFVLNGTSLAAAVVSGAVADLLEAQPSLTPDQVKARLMKTAYKTFPKSSIATDPTTGASYVDYYDIFTIGAGYIDIAAAISSNYMTQGTAMSPTASFNTNAGTITLNFNPSSVWAEGGLSGASTIWGNALAMGVTQVAGNSNILGTSAVWGTSGIWGTSAVWGTSGVWGTSAVWGTSVLAGTATTSGTSSNAADAGVVVNGEKN